MRAQATDYIQSSRFQASVIGAGGRQWLDRPGAGFSAITVPEATVESIEYKEGHHIYTMKQPGNVTVSDITLTRGVTRRDSSFWDWIRVVIEGTGEYRATVEVYQYARDTALPRSFPAVGDQNATKIDTDRPAKTYKCYNAFPIRVKPGGDLDATASEISLQEVDVAFENFEIVEGDPPPP